MNRTSPFSFSYVYALLLFFSLQAASLLGQDNSKSLDKEPNAEAAQPYDPLQVDGNQKVEAVLFEIEYQTKSKQSRRSEASSEARKVPVKVYLPTQKKAPVVLFSHGLGGSREGFRHGGEHWARRGYVAVFIQHPGSDESVWREKGVGQRMTAMREAASAQNLMSRIEDVKAVIDYLEKIDQQDPKIFSEAKQLHSRMDLKRLGMSGHSFGAITTQMVSGQSPVIPTQTPTDPRIRAAVVLSPSPPKIGQPDRYFSRVSIPWMLMTGTKDDSPIGDQTAETRLKVFPALPPGEKYQVVFDGGTHAFLGERAGLMDRGLMDRGLMERSNETATHAQATVALSTAFWDAHLSGDQNAKRWLDGDGPQKILAPKDQWQVK